MLSLLPDMMEDSWENWLSHLEMNDGFGCTNAVSSEGMVRFNNDGSNVVADIGPKVDYTASYLKSSEEEFGTSCYWHKRGVENNHELEAKAIRDNDRGTKRARTSSETQYHVMSERKRRQDIAEKFIALSATIPGLKKSDKATVLREALNYMQQLQQRIAVLEKAGSNKNKSIKSSIITKSRLCSVTCETNSINEVLPEVETRGLGKEVLIRIYCEKRKGIILKLMALLKDVHLSIASSSVLPFGNSILNIIIIAQMSEKYNLTVNDLAKSLKQIF